jgi:hypothetical protein
VGQDGGHVRDDLGEAVAQPLDGAAVVGGEGLLDGRFAQVAQQPVLGEELVAAGRPGVDLAEPSQVAVVVPAELSPGGAAVRGGQVTGEPFPGENPLHLTTYNSYLFS